MFREVDKVLVIDRHGPTELILSSQWCMDLDRMCIFNVKLCVFETNELIGKSCANSKLSLKQFETKKQK